VESRVVSSRGWRRWSALAVLTALVATGCVGVTASGSPSSLPAASPAETASALVSGSPSATATSAATDPASVPLAPSGTWKSIRWMSVPSTPLLPTPPPDQFFGVSIFGWSRGFVGFLIQSAGDAGVNVLNTATTTYSSDGVHWHAGPGLQQQAKDPLDIRGVFEGPDGLLAVEEAGACGDSWVGGLLTSNDGVTWQAVNMQKAFGNAVIWNVSGGSTGFVATDTVGQAVWTSRDGQNWQPVKLDTPAFARSRIDDGTAFSAGYVLVGSTELTGARSCGATSLDPSATPAPTRPLIVPAVWWSSDATNWVKAQLPGAKAGDTIQMSVQRLDDHTLAAFAYYDNAQHVWVSSNGRIWKPLAQPVTLLPFISAYSYCQDYGCFLNDGQHGVQLQALNGTVEDPYAGGMWLSTWADVGLVTLTQTGDQPPYDFGTEWTVGPTGVIVTDAGRLWIGLPSSN